MLVPTSESSSVASYVAAVTARTVCRFMSGTINYFRQAESFDVLLNSPGDLAFSAPTYASAVDRDGGSCSSSVLHVHLLQSQLN
jgi:hypothetical protein